MNESSRARATHHLIERLRALPSSDGLMNPYASHKAAGPQAHMEIGPEADRVRCRNLEIYLDHILDASGNVIFCGEAPGYQGARFTGIAFTDERLIGRNTEPLLQGCTLMQDAARGRRRLMKEPSAKAVWEALDRAESPVLTWNAVCLHPHHPGQPLTNRTPTADEVALGAETLGLIIEIVNPRLVVSVGRTAERALANLGVQAATVRHPAYGGKPEFLSGLRRLGVTGPPVKAQRSLFAV